MPANVESMFYTREAPWHGLGTRVEEAPDSITALQLAGLSWSVLSRRIYTAEGIMIPDYCANVRDTDDKVLGVVSSRYKIVQNEEAFNFTDDLIGEGVSYETAGSLQGGKKVWILARLPDRYFINGEKVDPYVVFMNTHDGSGSIKVSVTPVRVVCQNTLNLALSTAMRSWSAVHKGNIQNKLEEARETLALANGYMQSLKTNLEYLNQKSLVVREAEKIIKELIYTDESMPDSKRKNALKQQEDLLYRYHEAPDLKDLDHNAYRLINAVSDHATHSKPLRKTKNYQENLFSKVVDGHDLVDQAFKMILEVV